MSDKKNLFNDMNSMETLAVAVPLFISDDDYDANPRTSVGGPIVEAQVVPTYSMAAMSPSDIKYGEEYQIRAAEEHARARVNEEFWRVQQSEGAAQQERKLNEELIKGKNSGIRFVIAKKNINLIVLKSVSNFEARLRDKEGLQVLSKKSTPEPSKIKDGVMKRQHHVGAYQIQEYEVKEYTPREYISNYEYKSIYDE